MFFAQQIRRKLNPTKKLHSSKLLRHPNLVKYLEFTFLQKMWILPPFAKYICKQMTLLSRHRFICGKYSFICETYSCNKTCITLLLKFSVFKGLNRYLSHSHIFQDGLLSCMPLSNISVFCWRGSGWWKAQGIQTGLPIFLPSERKSFPRYLRLRYGTKTILYSDTCD